MFKVKNVYMEICDGFGGCGSPSYSPPKKKEKVTKEDFDKYKKELKKEVRSIVEEFLKEKEREKEALKKRMEIERELVIEKARAEQEMAMLELTNKMFGKKVEKKDPEKFCVVISL